MCQHDAPKIRCFRLHVSIGDVLPVDRAAHLAHSVRHLGRDQLGNTLERKLASSTNGHVPAPKVSRN